MVFGPRFAVKNLYFISLVFLFVIFIGHGAVSQASQSAQELYNEARNHYLKNEFKETKVIINELLKNHSGEKVEWGDMTPFKVGPAVLDMLGRIYMAEKNVDSAIDAFNKIVAIYSREDIEGPLDGEATYGGPAGAIAINCLMNIYLNNDVAQNYSDEPGFAIYWCNLLEGVNPNYKKAIELAYTLIRNFEGERRLSWEGCPNWEETAAENILLALDEMNVVVKNREKEVRKINKITKDEPLKASLLMRIGELYREDGQPENALRIFSEVIRQHENTFKEDDMAGDFFLYSMDAFLAIIHTYKQYKYPEIKQKAAFVEMKKHYDKFIAFLGTKYKEPDYGYHLNLFKAEYSKMFQ